MKWKNFPNWLKGGIIAVLIQIIFYIIGITTFIGFPLLFPNATTLMRVLATPLAFLMIIALFPSALLMEADLLSAGNEALWIIFSVLIYFLLGALIGWIIGKIKSKKKFSLSRPL